MVKRSVSFIYMTDYHKVTAHHRFSYFKDTFSRIILFYNYKITKKSHRDVLKVVMTCISLRKWTWIFIKISNSEISIETLSKFKNSRKQFSRMVSFYTFKIRFIQSYYTRRNIWCFYLNFDAQQKRFRFYILFLFKICAIKWICQGFKNNFCLSVYEHFIYVNWFIKFPQLCEQ